MIPFYLSDFSVDLSLSVISPEGTWLLKYIYILALDVVVQWTEHQPAN